MFDPSDPELLNADVAFPANEHSQPIPLFAGDHGILQRPLEGAAGSPGWSPPDLRRAFLRFFVALLQNYRRGLIAAEFDPESPQAMDKTRFLLEQPEG